VEGVLVPTYRPATSRTCEAPPVRPPSAPPAVAAAVGSGVPTAPAPRAVPAVDDEGPRFAPKRQSLGRRDEPQPSWFRHPGNGVTFELGAFFGGEDIITAQLSDGSTRTLSAGQGVALAIGGMWTPLWIGDDDHVGFGVGVSAGWKYDSIDASNASVSFTRYPVDVSLHALLRLDDSWLFLVKGGIQKELDIGISGGGDANQLNSSLNGGLGGFGEVGFYYVFGAGGAHLATAFTLRYTAVHDSVAGTSVPASNFGLLLYLFYNP
jgi:hypothetical protein